MATIEPIAWIEQPARVVLVADGDGAPGDAFFQVTAPPWVGQAAIGRPCEELARITPAISATSAVAHHLASAKALDVVFGVQPPPAGERLREVLLLADFIQSHARRFHVLLTAGRQSLASIPARSLAVPPQPALPARFVDQLLPQAAVARGVGVVLGGSAEAVVCAVPGGVSYPLGEAGRDRLAKIAADSLKFARQAQEILSRSLFDNPAWRECYTADAFTVPSHSLALVGPDETASWLGGEIKVVDQAGESFALFTPAAYADHLAEALERWTYQPFAYLKRLGWHGRAEPSPSGIFKVGPAARFNVGAPGISGTPLASAERERMTAVLGPGPYHNVAATYWVGMVEWLHAAERLVELSDDETILSPEIRALPAQVTGEGVGAVEAPAGFVLHHYRVDAQGIVSQAYVLDTATSNNAVRNLAARRAATQVLSSGRPGPEALRLVALALAGY